MLLSFFEPTAILFAWYGSLKVVFFLIINFNILFFQGFHNWTLNPFHMMGVCDLFFKNVIENMRKL